MREQMQQTTFGRKYFGSCGHNVPPDRVWNINEITLKMIGSSNRGWSSCGQKSEQILNDKHVIAYTLAICMVQQPLLAGLVFVCKTSRSLQPVEVHPTVHMIFY